jgi:phosphoglycerate kinase
MKYGIHTLEDFEWRGKVALCRVDINAPLDPETGALRDVTRLEGCAPTVKELAEADLPVGAPLVDIGHGTVSEYSAVIAGAGTVFVNGPAGVFERPQSEYGTKALWEAMAESAAFSALGGGDSVSAMNRFGLAGRSDYVCTAGGAMVQFLSGQPMPVIEALKGAAARFG